MALATWWNSDPLPELSPLPGFRAGVAYDNAALARLNRIPIAEVLARRRDGHRPYIAHLDGTPAAYGWVATRAASIGELRLTIGLPRADRYLWDFATLPEWRGRGVYPRLLQAILRRESRAAERFWIIYAPENLPSGAGMWKAGFTPVAELSFDAERQVRLAPSAAAGRARAAAQLLGVPLADDPLAPCWCCQGGEDSACWPRQGGTRACTCAVERRPARAPLPAGAGSEGVRWMS
jgi:GNAT superfamily N-acetyltransferase